VPIGVFHGEDTENGKQAGSRSPLATALPGSHEVVADGGWPEPEGVGVPLGVAVGRGVAVGTAVGVGVGVALGLTVASGDGSEVAGGLGGGGSTPGGPPVGTGLVQLITPTALASMTRLLSSPPGRSRPRLRRAGLPGPSPDGWPGAARP
jgi:hypothetical protein